MTEAPSKKYLFEEARKVAQEIKDLLAPHTERIIVAGSIRRQKPRVSDIELLYISKVTEIKPAQPSLLEECQDPSVEQDEVARALDYLISVGIIAKRKNVNGHEAWGPKNKLAVHVPSGIPVDFFSARASTWHNMLVCRTGGALNNKEIAMAAQRKGWKWCPYDIGFTDGGGNWHCAHSEREVFELAGVKYREPWERT